MKTLPKHMLFNTWSEAFDYCRDYGAPVTVRCDEDGVTEISKIFPSGRGEVIHIADRILPPTTVQGISTTN